MDVFQTVSGYITKMVSVGDGQTGSNAAKMKILLLDSETVRSALRILRHKANCTGLDRIFRNHAIRPPEPRSLPHRVRYANAHRRVVLTIHHSRIDNQNREKMRHLRCLCFLRPSSDSIQFLIDEFREPKYGEYNICKRMQETAVDDVLTDTKGQTLAT